MDSRWGCRSAVVVFVFFFSQNKSGTRSVKSKIIFQARFKNKSHAVYAQPFHRARAARAPSSSCV